MNFNKFAWIKALAADRSPGLTGTDKHILTLAAIVNVKGGTDKLCVRQATLATTCGTTEGCVPTPV